MVRSRSCRIIYYFNTPTLRRRHQSFSRVSIVLVSFGENVYPVILGTTQSILVLDYSSKSTNVLGTPLSTPVSYHSS